MPRQTRRFGPFLPEIGQMVKWGVSGLDCLHPDRNDLLNPGLSFSA